MSRKAVFFDIDGTLWDEHFVIPESTKEAIRKLAPELGQISPERIRTELEKLITFDHPIRKSDKPFKRFYDFTVGRPLKSSHKIIAACGKNKVFNKGNEPALPITQKVYLMDSDFEVHVHGPIELLEKIGHALDFPVFTYYFGNKNCIPSERVNRGIVEE